MKALLQKVRLVLLGDGVSNPNIVNAIVYVYRDLFIACEDDFVVAYRTVPNSKPFFDEFFLLF